MKTTIAVKTIIAAAGAALALASAAGAQTMSVTANVTSGSGLYNYDYLFSLTGPAGAGTSVANLYLTSDDLSPVGPFTFAKDGTGTSLWTYASNDTPYNYLQFFSTSDSLTNGDTLEVKFASAFARLHGLSPPRLKRLPSATKYRPPPVSEGGRLLCHLTSSSALLRLPRYICPPGNKSDTLPTSLLPGGGVKMKSEGFSLGLTSILLYVSVRVSRSVGLSISTAVILYSR